MVFAATLRKLEHTQCHMQRFLVYHVFGIHLTVSELSEVASGLQELSGFFMDLRIVPSWLCACLSLHLSGFDGAAVSPIPYVVKIKIEILRKIIL